MELVHENFQFPFFYCFFLDNYYFLNNHYKSIVLIEQLPLSGADTGKNEPPQNFLILSNVYPIFHNVSPIFHWQNFSRFASANVAVVWIRAWLYFTISYFLKTFLLNLFSETFSFKFKQNQCFFKLMFIKYKYYFLFLDIVTLKDDSYCF